MKLYVTALVALLVLCGCTTTDFSSSGDSGAAPYAGEVQVLERLPAKGSYTMLGVLIVRGVNLTSDERMFEQLKERAAAQGANAVVLQGPIIEQENTTGGVDRRLGGFAIVLHK